MATLKSHGFIGTRHQKIFELNLIFDFSVDTNYKDFTYVNTQGNGIVIDNSNGWVTNNGTNANGYVYKRVNASKAWTRILFSYRNASASVSQGGATNGYKDNTGNATTAVTQYGVNNNREYVALNNKTNNTSENYDFALGTEYYLDLIFENGYLTSILYDINFNILKQQTLQTSDTTCDYIGFGVWNYGIDRYVRIKKFRAAYEREAPETQVFTYTELGAHDETILGTPRKITIEWTSYHNSGWSDTSSNIGITDDTRHLRFYQGDGSNYTYSSVYPRFEYKTGGSDVTFAQMSTNNGMGATGTYTTKIVRDVDNGGFYYANDTLKLSSNTATALEKIGEVFAKIAEQGTIRTFVGGTNAVYSGPVTCTIEY